MDCNIPYYFVLLSSVTISQTTLSSVRSQARRQQTMAEKVDADYEVILNIFNHILSLLGGYTNYASLFSILNSDIQLLLCVECQGT